MRLTKKLAGEPQTNCSVSSPIIPADCEQASYLALVASTADERFEIARLFACSERAEKRRRFAADRARELFIFGSWRIDAESAGRHSSQKLPHRVAFATFSRDVLRE